MSKTIIMFGGPLTLPSTRFRLSQYIPYLEARGYSVHLPIAFPHPPAPLYFSPRSLYRYNMIRRFSDVATGLRRSLQLLATNPNSTIIIQRFLTPILSKPLLEIMAKKRSCRLIVDFDDAIFELNTQTDRKLSAIIKLADAVIVGNEYLQSYALNFNSNISIVPTPIETQYYQPKSFEQRQELVTVGWMGSWSNIRYLELLSNVFKQLKQKFTNLRIIAVTDAQNLPDSLISLVQLKPWSLDEELKDLQSFDIGLMPLSDDLWTKGKCAFKLIQYMAVGIPVVASPVGMNKDVVRKNDFLCTSEEEWLQALEKLCLSSELRQQMGLKNRQVCETDYATQTIFSRFLRVVDPQEGDEECNIQ